MAAVLTHPADTLKTRLQGDLFAVKGSGREPVNIHVRAAIEDMMVTWGRTPKNMLYGMYAGFTPRLFRLVCKIIFFIYLYFYIFISPLILYTRLFF